MCKEGKRRLPDSLVTWPGDARELPMVGGEFNRGDDALVPSRLEVRRGVKAKSSGAMSAVLR